ncbi:MAG: hypothetical protein ABIJ56_07310 [Pseudomonadota bacterium]
MQDEKKEKKMEEQKQVKAPPPSDDLDVKSPKGMGMKIVVTLIILAVIGGIGYAAYYYILLPEQQRQQKLQMHEDFLAAYTTVKNTGYNDFWKCVFPLATEEQANTNLKLESIINNAISQQEEKFGKHIGGCLETLKKHVEVAKTMESPAEYEEQVKQLPGVLEAVYDAWKALSDEFSQAGQRGTWDKRLDDAATKGWGQLYVDYENRKKPTDETLRFGRRYMKFVTCAVGKTYQEMGNKVEEVGDAIVKEVMQGVCSTPEKAMERFAYIEDNCVTFLTAPNPPAPDEDFDHVMKKGLYYETKSLAVIAGSWEGEDGCVRAARKEKQKLMIQNLFNSWVAYKTVAKSVEDVYIKITRELKKK